MDDADVKVDDGVVRGIRQHEAGVPRRFGVGILLVIATMYAVLFAIMRTLAFPPAAFVLIALFFTGVGLGQMLLFKGKRPRRASVIVGGILCPSLFLAVAVIEGVVHRIPTVNLLHPDFWKILGYCTITGTILGYLAGMLIAVVVQFESPVRENQA